jgi:hypothetical protein
MRGPPSALHVALVRVTGDAPFDATLELDYQDRVDAAGDEAGVVARGEESPRLVVEVIAREDVIGIHDEAFEELLILLEGVEECVDDQIPVRRTAKEQLF